MTTNLTAETVTSQITAEAIEWRMSVGDFSDFGRRESGPIRADLLPHTTTADLLLAERRCSVRMAELIDDEIRARIDRGADAGLIQLARDVLAHRWDASPAATRVWWHRWTAQWASIARCRRAREVA